MASRGRSRYRQLDENRRQPEPPVRWLKFPIVVTAGRKLRVLIYCRYSTDEQSPRSIDVQIAFCKRFLALLGITDVEFTIISDCGHIRGDAPGGRDT